MKKKQIVSRTITIPNGATVATITPTEIEIPATVKEIEAVAIRHATATPTLKVQITDGSGKTIVQNTGTYFFAFETSTDVLKRSVPLNIPNTNNKVTVTLTPTATLGADQTIEVIFTCAE